MKHYGHGIGGLRTGFSPSAVGSSSLPFTAFKSEHEDSVWGDYSLDLSFLSSDDQRSALDDDDSLSNLSRDVDTTKEGEVLEDKKAHYGAVTTLPEQCSKIAGDDNVDTTTNSSTQTDPEEDSPCWIGLLSLKNLDSAAKSVSSRRSTDDLSGFYRLNPLAPQFIPSNSKNNGKRAEETNSSSLKKSLSSTFPSSSGEFSITDPLEDGNISAARGEDILTNNADESFGFLPQDLVSKSVSMLESGKEFQTSKKLDPLAPVFVPACAKPSPLVHEKQGAVDATSHSTSALTSPDNELLNKFKVETCSGEVGPGIKIRYPDGVSEFGSTSSYNPCIESKVGITEYAKLESSSNKPHGQRRLNPLAPQFSLAATKPKAYGYIKNQAADDLSILSPPNCYRDDTVVDADLAQSPVYGDRLLPNVPHGNSSLISFKTDGNFESLKRFGVESNTTLSMKDSMDLKHSLPFHFLENGSPSDVKALSGYGQRHSYFASSTSPKLDVKKLLTTMHGLSELLTLAHGSESSDFLNAQELDLINTTVQNLNTYIRNSSQEQAGNQSIIRHSPYDLKSLPNKSKLWIRDLQLPRADSMTIDLDVKSKEKCSMVSGEMVPDYRLCEYVATTDNSLGQVVPPSGYQHNHQGSEQISQHALFYKSLWLKAEADRCLMVYETSLSNPAS